MLAAGAGESTAEAGGRDIGVSDRLGRFAAVSDFGVGALLRGMEDTGGEPEVAGRDDETGEALFIYHNGAQSY